MSQIKSRDTTPEIRVRSLAHRLGYRFRLHRRDLPGNPDIVFPGKSKAVLVHGCFWHGHYCKRTKMPKSRKPFWTEKIRQNMLRDRRTKVALEKLGWRTLVVWECETKHADNLAQKLARFLA